MDHSIIRITKVRTPRALLQSPDALDSSILMAQRVGFLALYKWLTIMIS